MSLLYCRNMKTYQIWIISWKKSSCTLKILRNFLSNRSPKILRLSPIDSQKPYLESKKKKKIQQPLQNVKIEIK